MKLKVSDNGRFLVYEDGTPFFYLADTAWEILSRLSREEAEYYLEDRTSKGFTVIQAVALVELDFGQPNRSGHLALKNNDPSQPDEGYFGDMDWFVRQANARGLTVALLPTWGDKWNKAWGKGPEIFNPENAFAYGLFLGRRYSDAGVIWVLGGDRPIETDTHYAILRAMANGLTEGDGGTHLRTFHPPGSATSAEWLHDEAWLDFNMWQTGHNRDRDNYHAISADYARPTAKPVLDAEPGYENHPEGFNPANGYLDAYDVRKAAYGAVFAGAFGHTYGCHDIWQFLDSSRAPAVSWAHTPWREALSLPGSGQMRYLRALIESRPFLSRIPDQSLLASEAGVGTHHVQATRDAGGRYALIYSASGRPFAVDISRLSGHRITIKWYNPRTGESAFRGYVPRQKVKEFTPPSSGHGQDWVLVLDNENCAFPEPGSARFVGS